MAAAASDRPSVATAALAALGDSDGEDVRELMTKSLGATDPRVVRSAAGYFGSHHDEAAVPALRDLAAHGGREADQAMIALSNVGGDAARTALFDLASRTGTTTQATALQQLATLPGGAGQARTIALSLVHQGGQAASTAVDILGTDTSPEGREALLHLVRAGGTLAPNAITQLARRGDPESIAAVTELARGSKRTDQRMTALGSLGETSDPRAQAVLLDAARDKDPQVRRVALQQLAVHGGPDAERAIADAASAATADPRSRTFAVSALGRLATPEANQKLEALTRDTDSNVARFALTSLARNDPEAAARIAIQSISSTDASTRLTAINVADQLDQDSMKRIYMTGMRDEDPMVVGAAARSLGQLGGPDAQRALIDLLTSSSSTDEQKRTAAEVMQEMGGDGAERYKDAIGKYTGASSSGGDTDDVDTSEIMTE
jgi:HEAT repeat protein